MKIRHGFVSNSSTSSFVCFGIPLNTDSKIEVFKKLVGYKNKGTIKQAKCQHKFNRDKFKFCPECGEVAWNVIDQDEDFVDAEIGNYECGSESKLLRKMGLELVTGWLDDYEETVYFLGIDLEDNTDNGKETLAKINKVNSVIIELFPEKDQDQNFYSGVNS